MMATALSEKLNELISRASRDSRAAEAGLYLRRAKIAAAEERYDVARVFCQKAIETDAQNLEALFCLARTLDVGFGETDAAIALYQKIIALAGYEGANPCCAAAREALSALGNAGNRQG
jgi:tetratricopeptide (TPR) repeat protein